MKKFLFILFGVFVVAGAFAAGENIPTSKSYVDSKLVEKQDIIPANYGVARVLTNTGTAGEYDTRGIYDATGEYAAQQNNLVDAVTMNTAVQNAIDSEFQCISWVDDDPTKDCLLFDVLGGRLPPGYTKLEYIASSGAQWIDTGIALTPNFDFYFDGMILSNGGGGYLFGTSAGNQNLEVGVYSATLLSSSINGSHANGGISYGGSYNRFRIGLSPHRILNYDGTERVLKRRYSPAGTFYLFRASYEGSRARARIYGAELYDGDTLAFKLVPARRDSDDTLGLYDTVRNIFLTNSGTGNFISGPVASPYLPSGN